METMRFLKFSLFTILTLMAYLTPTKVTAEESSFAPAPVAGAGSQPTVSRALLLFSLFIFCSYVCNSLFYYPYSLSIPEKNFFANFISNNPSFYEGSVPNEHLSDYNQIGSLTSSDLQEIESVGNMERDNAQQNNLHSENRQEGTSPLLDLLAYEERVVVEEVDDAVENYGRRIETTEPDEVDKQKNVNETTEDHKCSGRITLADLQRQSGKKINDAAASLGVSRSIFKRSCRAHGIARGSHKRIVQQPAAAILTQSISVKISYNDVNIKFSLNHLSGKNDLEFEIEKRLGIQTGSFWIKYEDEDKD